MGRVPVWHDESWPWMIKLARAKKHIDDLSAEADDFQKRASRIEKEPGQNPGDIVLRLRVSKPIPPHLSAVAGDILYNMRSALDTAAYELGRRHCPEIVDDEDLQRRSEFPFQLKKTGLDSWFEQR
jgi:urease accessory protein UreE